MELHPTKEARNSIETLHEEIWLKIFEAGISNEENKFIIKDISSLLITCKFFNRLWSEDALWSLLVTLDFPQFADDAGSKPYSSSKKLLYKYCLARHCKKNFDYYEHELMRVEKDIQILSKRINRIDFRIRISVEEMECEIKGIRDAVNAADNGMVQRGCVMVDSVKRRLVDQKNDIAKYQKRDELMRFYVEIKEWCEKNLSLLQISLVKLCIGAYPIDFKDLLLPGDRIEDDDDFVKENVEVEDDFVDVDTTDYEDEDEDEDEEDEEDGVEGDDAVENDEDANNFVNDNGDNSVEIEEEDANEDDDD